MMFLLDQTTYPASCFQPGQPKTPGSPTWSIKVMGIPLMFAPASATKRKMASPQGGFWLLAFMSFSNSFVKPFKLCGRPHIL